MSSYALWQFTETDMTSLANQAKEQILFALANEDLLKGDPEEIASQYAIVLHKKGWLGSIWDRIRGTNKDGTFFAVVKSVSTGVPHPEGSKEEPPKPRPNHLKSVPKPVYGNDD